MALKKSGKETPLPSKAEVTAEPKAKQPVDRPADKQITLVHQDQHVRIADLGVYVVIDGKQIERQVEVRDNQVVLEINDENLALRDVLVRDGFRDKTYYARESNRIMDPSKPIAVYWYFVHPDRSPENPINGTIGLHTPSGEVEVDIRDGQVETDRQDVSEALIRSGYICVKTDTELPKE